MIDKPSAMSIGNRYKGRSVLRRYLGVQSISSQFQLRKWPTRRLSKDCLIDWLAENGGENDALFWKDSVMGSQWRRWRYSQWGPTGGLGGRWGGQKEGSNYTKMEQRKMKKRRTNRELRPEGRERENEWEEGRAMKWNERKFRRGRWTREGKGSWWPGTSTPDKMEEKKKIRRRRRMYEEKQREERNKKSRRKIEEMEGWGELGRIRGGLTGRKNTMKLRAMALEKTTENIQHRVKSSSGR